MNEAVIKVAKKAADSWRGTDEYYQAATIIDMLLDELNKCDTNSTGCDCCTDDEALLWQDATNNAFVDSKGEVLVTAKDHTLRFKVKRCPNCGRRFVENE